MCEYIIILSVNHALNVGSLESCIRARATAGDIIHGPRQMPVYMSKTICYFQGACITTEIVLQSLKRENREVGWSVRYYCWKPEIREASCLIDC